VSPAEHQPSLADPVFDALAQAALDYGAGEETISIGSVDCFPATVYHLLLRGVPDRKARFDPGVVLEKQGLEMDGVLVEDGATLLLFRTAWG
jgi:hypothetical protein